MKLLVTMPGISQTAAQVMASEMGADMRRFPSADSLVSWVTAHKDPDEFDVLRRKLAEKEFRFMGDPGELRHLERVFRISSYGSDFLTIMSEPLLGTFDTQVAAATALPPASVLLRNPGFTLFKARSRRALRDITCNAVWPSRKSTTRLSRDRVPDRSRPARAERETPRGSCGAAARSARARRVGRGARTRQARRRAARCA